LILSKKGDAGSSIALFYWLREWLRGIGAASLQAFLASFGALLAVVMVVLRAFVVALLANFDALAHDVWGVRRVAGDVCGREPTDIGAVAVEPNTGHHHFDVFFVEASIGAKLTGGDAAG
jgi:hypothetical protein